MAQDSKIEWTTHTFNPWRGCTKVSDGCKFCYAETLSGRNPAVLGVWGPKGARPTASDTYWRQPLRWDREAQASGIRPRVFCASLADVFEGDETMPETARKGVQNARLRLLALIVSTPSLDWLLLTKRPENILPQLEEACVTLGEHRECGLTLELGEQLFTRLRLWQKGYPPPNVWLGTSVEDQQSADTRVLALLNVPAAVRFLSCEPLLGPVNISRFLWPVHWGWDAKFDSPQEALAAGAYAEQKRQALVSAYARFVHWVIVGGESGPNARPMHPDWVRSLRDQCTVAGTSFFFKQWGEYSPDSNLLPGQDWPQSVAHFGIDGQPFPQGMTAAFSAVMYRVGKKAAGRLLDGRTWDEIPETVKEGALNAR